MKRFTSLLITLFLAISAMAQSETKTVTVTPSGGSFKNGGNVVTSGWASNWTSSTEPIVTISVGSVNNMNAGTTSGFQMARGSNADSDWTFSIADYKVTAYSFKFKSAIENQNVTLTATNADGTEVSMTSSYSTEQTFSIDCSNAATATFRISGSNYSIIATELTLTYREPLALTSLEVGQVYHFENVLYPGFSLNANSATDVDAVTTNETDTKQQWYVEKQDGEYYVLRNLAYGKYLKGNGQSSAWSMSDDYSHDYNKFKLFPSNADYNTLHTNTLGNYAYIHCNSSKNIVGWSNSVTDQGSHWTITQVDYTDAQIKELLEKAPTVAEVAAYPAALGAIFSDAACVTPALASLAAAQATDAYDALPATLKAMVDKVYREKTESVALETAWREDNANDAKDDWSGEYAKKFRVQMYEPYSIAGDITGFLRMNAHANNDNPTGIYVAEAGTIYVMVEGTIKNGASLRLVRAGSNGRVTEATTAGYALTTGLNVINITEVTAGGDHLYICYNVDTYNPDGANVEEQFPHKLSKYPPLKIHIEGGYINGFYSSCGDYLAGKTYDGVTYNEDLWGGVDDDDDWVYMETRANLSVLPIISHRQVLLFQLNADNGYNGLSHFLPESVSVPETPFSYPQNGETSSWDDYDAYGMDCNISKGKINIWMETWDRIMHAELATLGLISEDDVNIMNKFYPRWKSDGTKAEIYDMTNAGPDGNTYKVFCRGLDYSEYYNHHGVSLGTTSGYMSAGWNAANYNISTFEELMGMPTSGGLWGPVHEIGHQFQDVFNIRGATEVTNNVFSNAATWYQGISTSRYNGGNLTTTLDNFNSGLPFVDYNIWSMTQMFYKLWLYYHLAGNNTQFYPRFFEMLRVDPLNAKGATATGTESMLKIYEKMCDAAGEDLTEFFRAHGFFVLLDNYAKGDYGTTIFTQTQEEVDAAIARVKEKYTKENFAVILINDGAEATLRHDGETSRTFFDGTAHPEYGGVNDFIDGSATTGGAYTATVNSDGTMTMIGEGGIGFLVFDENGKIISFNDNSTFALSDEAKEAILTGNATIVSVGSDINAEPVVADIDLTAMQKAILGELIAKAQAIIDKIDDTYTKIGFYKAAAVADLAVVLENAKTVYKGTSGYEAAYDLLYAEYQKVLANTDAKIPFDPSLTYIITNKAYTNQTMWVNNELVVRSEAGVDQTADAAKWQFKATASDGVYNIYNKKGYYCPAVTQSTAMTATTTANADALYTLQEIETGVWAIKLSPAAGYRNFHSSWDNVVGWEIGSDASRWYLTAVDPNTTMADLTNLEVYITKTEALLGEVLGTVTYTTGENIDLQTTTEGSAGYIWSNAPCATEGNITNLVDGATNNYFHTEWNGDAVTSGDHYIAVDLGAGNTLPRFAFSHTTRSGAENDFPKSVDVYGSDEKNGTYKYLGSATGMPQSAGTFWQFEGVMISSHRYLRFNMHANRGYWHMAEFDIMPVTGFTATVNDTYSATVTIPTVTAAMEAMYNGKGVAFSMSPEEGDIEDKLEALQNAYKALYAEYEATVNARKQTLAELAANTQNLINQVGTVSFAQETPVELNDGNFYCNAPYIASNNDDNSADYVSKLTDGNNSTYLHTRWNANSDDGDYHYLRVDMGEGVSIGKFNFTYTTASRGKKDMPLTMVVEGTNEIDGDNTTADTFTEIVTLTSLPEVINTNTDYNSEVLGSNETPYRYLRFKVTDITVDESDGNGHPFFTMAEFALSSIVDEKTTVNAPYKSVVSEELLLSSVHTTNSSNAMSTNALVTSVPLLDAQIAGQQIAYNKLNEAMQKVACDKTALVEYLVTANSLYEEFSEDDAIAPYYATSSVTLEQITALKGAIDASNAVVANDDAIQTDVDEALATLKAKAQVLEDIKADDYSGSRETIGSEISNAATLLAEVITAAETLGDVPLQASDATAPYYIWSNRPADDSNGIEGGLIDKNDDGTANTNTFFGTNWRSGDVEPYTHYLEVDLGSVKSIKELLFNYTTRASYANQRPNGIKVLASNDKNIYKEVFSVTDGLPTGGTEKWELEEPLNFVGRYIRFAVSTEVGYFNMADFNLSIAETYALNEFYTTSDIDASLIAALNVAVQQASAAKDCFVLEDDYNTALANLQNAYNTLNGFKNAHVTDVSELGELATTTDLLVTEVATFTEEEKEITMQCDDENDEYYLYCNAEGKDNGGDDDNGVAALVGDNATNDEHLHTAYKGSTDDDLDHYLRLDMGENKVMVSFKFSYTGRKSGNNNDPTEMRIEGSNDLENFELITKLTGLPTSTTPTTYESEVLGNGKAYRYIRFMVTATNNNAKYNGHPFFVLSRFAVTACKTIEVKSDYVSPNLPLSTLVAANNEVVDANAVVNSTTYVTSDAYETALEELQAAKDALVLAQNLKDLPVILTTDVNNPVLYKIKIARDGNKLLQFDNADKKVAVVDETFGNEYQAWYFMQGSVDNDYDDIRIMPYWNDGAANVTLKLGSNSISDGAEKVWAVDGNDSSYKTNWYITFTEGKTATNWWNIQPEGKGNYFSNNGGVGNKMGFWSNEQSPSDGGSNFQFILDETDYTLSDAYFALYNLHASCGGAKGSAIGCYTEETVNEYNDAYEAATTQLAATAATDDEYNAARTALENAYNGLTRNMPVEGGFYKIRSAYKTDADVEGYCYGGVVYAGDNNDVRWAKGYDETSSRAIWYITPVDGGYQISSLHTGGSFAALSWGAQAVLSDEPATFTIETLDDVTGILKIASGQPMHAQQTGSAIVGYPGGLNSASAWTIEAVAEQTTIGQSITLNTAAGEEKSYSTLYSAYPVTLPDGVDASIITDRADNGLLTMQAITSESNRVVPAYTAVILSQGKGDTSSAASVAGEVKFSTAESAVAIAEGVNMLQGTLTTEYVACGVDCADWKVYTLGRKNNRVAMYWAYANYDASGNRVTFEGTTSHDKGGYVKMGANKAYLKVGGGTPASVISMYSFWFGGETTGIDGIDNSENALDGTIYDLQGRKITEVTSPGIYIVNGKKVYIGDVE